LRVFGPTWAFFANLAEAGAGADVVLVTRDALGVDALRAWTGALTRAVTAEEATTANMLRLGEGWAKGGGV
jgi:hypothetical protein